MSTFTINDPGRELKLADGKAELRYDVRNEAKTSVLARAGVVTTPPNATDWFSFDGNTERLLQAGESTTWTLRVQVPKTASAGPVKFQLQVVDADQTDDRGNSSSLTEFQVSAEKKPLPWKWILIAAGALFAIIAAIVAYILLSGGVKVPELEGRPITEARAELERLGLVIEEQGQVGDAPENSVVQQDPKAGEEIDRGSKVKVIFELPDVVIPDLVGKPLTEALPIVNALGLLAAQPVIVNEDLNQVGKVLATTPAAGTRVKGGTAFEWKVEEPTSAVPNLIGQRFQDAVAALEGAGFQHEMEVVTRDATRQGQVLDQNPVTGTFVQKGRTKIRLVVEKSRIECPNVTGLSEAAAKQALIAAKLVAKTLPQRVLLQGGAVGNVALQSPAPLSPMFEGGEVTLTLVGVPVTVPDVRGAGSFDNAKRILERAGLIAEMQNVRTRNLGEVGKIVGQEPLPGVSVLKGSSVFVSVLQFRYIPSHREVLQLDAIRRIGVKVQDR